MEKKLGSTKLLTEDVLNEKPISNVSPRQGLVTGENTVGDRDGRSQKD